LITFYVQKLIHIFIFFSFLISYPSQYFVLFFTIIIVVIVTTISITNVIITIIVVVFVHPPFSISIKTHFLIFRNLSLSSELILLITKFIALFFDFFFRYAKISLCLCLIVIAFRQNLSIIFFIFFIIIKDCIPFFLYNFYLLASILYR